MDPLVFMSEFHRQIDAEMREMQQRSEQRSVSFALEAGMCRSSRPLI